MATQPLILSSSSPARRALLSRLGVTFTPISPDIDETPKEGENVTQLVARLAKEKALASSKQFPDALIIGADQVGALDQEILCKPLNAERAFAQLKMVSGHVIRFYTGLCLYDAKTKSLQETIETYDVHFKKLSDAQIKNYINKENILNCAGSFQAEGLGITLIEKFAGDDYTALIGLPLIQLTNMLTQAKFYVS